VLACSEHLAVAICTNLGEHPVGGLRAFRVGSLKQTILQRDMQDEQVQALIVIV